MKRREFFRGGSVLATAGLVGTAIAAAKSTTAIAATPKVSPTIFDFGAVGDGVTDDAPAFKKALTAASLEGRKVIVPGFTYAIKTPINWVSSGNAVKLWGFESQGAVLKSFLTGGQDVLSLTSQHLVRYFSLTGGMSIKCTGSDGNGFRLSCPYTGGKYIYNCSVDRLTVEGAGKDDLLVDGNVFESQFTNSFFQDAKGNGATFAHNKGGVCSSINLIGCYFNQNGKHGLECTTFDSTYGGASDVRVLGGYARNNKLHGMRYNNGTAPGASIMNVGFENNYTSVSPGNDTGSHLFGQVRMQVRDCMGYNESGGATYFLRGWFSATATLDGCSHSAGGAMLSTGKSRLVQLNGSSAGMVVMRSCAGGLTIASGNQAKWQAQNCTGPSPIGELSNTKTMGSV